MLSDGLLVCPSVDCVPFDLVRAESFEFECKRSEASKNLVFEDRNDVN